MRRLLLALAVHRATGELRPWALALLARRRRWRAWWYQRGLPRLIRARALLRRWCRRARLGRVLCWPLPAPLLALLALAAQMAGKRG